MSVAEKPILTARDGGNTGNAGAVLSTPNAQNQYEVTRGDLPLACPMPGMQLWNSHPKVYLPIEKTGWAKCPYCSAEFTLKRVAELTNRR